ncbi:hypothetical protein RZE82_00220 [Mollicutes bacterium LVI A0039]|nr:hypothetical protein RZE82_00220 [Mollicutes bacterium LVI A0039]
MKVLAVASAGGHLSELKMITNNLSDKFEVTIITEDKGKDDPSIDYFIPYSNRANKLKYLFAFINNFRLAFKHLRIVRPEKIISTGAHTAFFYFVVGKVFFKTTNVYIESYAKVTSESLAYRLSKRFIDTTIVQHQEMQDVEVGSKFFGGVY